MAREKRRSFYNACNSMGRDHWSEAEGACRTGEHWESWGGEFIEEKLQGDTGAGALKKSTTESWRPKVARWGRTHRKVRVVTIRKQLISVNSASAGFNFSDGPDSFSHKSLEYCRRASLKYFSFGTTSFHGPDHPVAHRVSPPPKLRVSPHKAHPRAVSASHALPLSDAHAVHHIQSAAQAREWILRISRIRELTPEDYEILLFLDEGAKNVQLMNSEAIIALPCAVNPESLGETCAICLGAMKDDEDIRVLPICGHHFHMHCVHEWLSTRRAACPLCGQNMPIS